MELFVVREEVCCDVCCIFVVKLEVKIIVLSISICIVLFVSALVVLEDTSLAVLLLRIIFFTIFETFLEDKVSKFSEKTFCFLLLFSLVFNKVYSLDSVKEL